MSSEVWINKKFRKSVALAKAEKKRPISESAQRARAERLLRALKKLFPRPKIALRYSNNWELLVAVILSAQCTDKKVNEVTAKLFSAKGGSATGGKKYRTVDDFVHADQKDLEKIIYPCGFYKNKARNILATAKIIKEKYNGKVPDSMEKLLTLKGVARKTANVVLGNAFGIVEGIAVDTHVARLAQRFGLTKEKNPEKIERDLMVLFPKKEWFTLTYRLIEYGRHYCPARTCSPHHPLSAFDRAH